MATWRRGNTEFSLVLEEAKLHAANLNSNDLPVVRVKVEAGPFNFEIPITDKDAADHDANNYFEHHIKLRRSESALQGQLLEVCQHHNAHLSRNAFRQVEDGQEERFVTLRTYNAGRTTSSQQLERLLGALRELNEQIIEYESEYCVYDSNLDLDSGWLSHVS
ncbi:MAG: hypothetical protein ACFCD0_06390 [Gemmataceae bacterium]